MTRAPRRWCTAPAPSEPGVSVQSFRSAESALPARRRRGTGGRRSARPISWGPGACPHSHLFGGALCCLLPSSTQPAVDQPATTPAGTEQGRWQIAAPRRTTAGSVSQYGSLIAPDDLPNGLAAADRGAAHVLPWRRWSRKPQVRGPPLLDLRRSFSARRVRFARPVRSG